MKLTLNYAARRTQWVALLACGEAVRWTLLRLCDLGVALRTRADRAELAMQAVHLQRVAERHRQGCRALRQGMRQERRLHPWPPRRLSAAELATAGTEACAVDDPRPLATVHQIHGVNHASTSTAEAATCRKPS